MGQSSSRQRSTQDRTFRPDEPRSTSIPTVQTDTNGQHVGNGPSAAGAAPESQRTASTLPVHEAKRSRRESVRQHLHSLRSSTRPTSVASSSQLPGRDSSFFKKRWRSSRRWSKTPETLDEPVDLTNEIGHGNGHAETIKDAGAEQQQVEGSSHGTHVDGSSRPSTPFPASGSSTPRSDNNAESGAEILSEEEHRASQNIGTWLGGSSTPVTPEDAMIHREVLDFLNDGPSGVPPEQDPREPEAQIEQAPAPEPQQLPAPPAAFQSPSTLVVVQGVVNAQDPGPMSYPPSSSQTLRPSSRLASSGSQSELRRRSSPNSRSGARPGATNEERSHIRNRLSSFIRPNSMLGRNQSDDTNLAASGDTASDNIPPTDASTTSDAEGNTQTSNDNNTPQADARSSSRGLSPGSIDVLGTLLSVAATATAASLFTARPLPYPSNTDNTNTVPAAPLLSSRPLSPTPTSGLGALGALGGLSQNGSMGSIPDNSNRVRNLMDILRGIVGFNSRNAPDALPSADAPAVAQEQPEQRMHSGEAMLADMARALHAGLGLPTAPPPHISTDGTASSNITIVAPPRGSTEASNSPPAEGSFEQFLLNLQTDLRNLLSEDSASGSSSSSNEVDSSDPASSSSTSATEPAEESQSAMHSEMPSDEAVVSHSATLDGPEAAHTIEGEDRAPSVAPVDSDFEDAADIQGEDEQNESATVEMEEAPETAASSQDPHPRIPTPIPSMWTSTPAYNDTRERVLRASRAAPQDGRPRAQPRTPRAGNTRERGERERPAINLWRLYRFAPIPATQAQETASRVPRPPMAGPATEYSPASSAAVAADPTLPSSPTLPESHGQPQASTSSAGPTPPEPTPAAPAVVIPVIVVGLQSVETRIVDDDDDLQFGQPPRDAMEAGPSRMPENPLAWAAQGGAPPAGAGRSWGSRAANALRGLRPGARRASRTRRSNEGPASRTFLIYVIGGYYPPGHHMVTGSDRLDSYEALWELAELLGQAKPPTATKEEIEKSGLQVIRGSDIGRYETEGKISSNCTDRCLVCLDDYEQEDEVRVLSCRHAFHKDCVDKWLQVGRNNCPACRTKGVSSDDVPPPPTQQPSTPAPPSEPQLSPLADGGV
ncbi:hypothetical protein BDW22DRAFT_1481899 [Trametopsis cervina]|nr:hypothetical protein BDW22DRAFT_1481899 [Trametopsis cervina]